MANEFVARNGIIALNNSQITGSLNVTNGITGSLYGTASYATTASYALNAPTSISSSYSTTASYVLPLRQTVEITGSLGKILFNTNLPLIYTRVCAPSIDMII